MVSWGLSTIGVGDGLRCVERSDILLGCGECSMNEKELFTIEAFYASRDQF